MTAPLQVCASGQSGHEYLYDFEFIKALTCTYADPAGLLVLGVFVYGAIATSIYVETGQPTIPVVIVLVAGGALLAQVSGIATTIATVLLLTVGAGSITYLYLRFSR